MKSFKGLKIGIIAVSLIIFFLILNLTFLGKSIKNFFYLVSAPIQKILWNAGDKTSDFLVGFFQAENFKKENEEFRLKIQELLSQNASLSELKKENAVLREALGVGLEKEFQLVLAQVTGKDVSQDSISIDKGFRDGISEGLPVITQEKVLIGKIGEVYKDFSKVILISDSKSSFDAKIVNTETVGIVEGKGNLKIFLDLIPREKEIKKGDQVVTSALGGVFPGGLLVGEVTQVQKLDVKPFQTATLQPALNLNEIEKLFIITEF